MSRAGGNFHITKLPTPDHAKTDVLCCWRLAMFVSSEFLAPFSFSLFMKVVSPDLPVSRRENSHDDSTFAARQQEQKSS